MKELSILCQVKSCRYEELTPEDKRLVEEAKSACQGSHSPYSGFRVGAALVLANGTIVQGSNQENVSYPNGICAERTALFYAGSTYPTQQVGTMAIAACTDKGFTTLPCTPCGACRQVMLETEERQGSHPIRLVLYGKEECYIVEGGARALLPLQFNNNTIHSISEYDIH